MELTVVFFNGLKGCLNDRGNNICVNYCFFFFQNPVASTVASPMVESYD